MSYANSLPVHPLEQLFHSFNKVIVLTSIYQYFIKASYKCLSLETIVQRLDPI